MKPHPRIRKTIKWGGVAVTVLLVVVWIGSCWVRVFRDDGMTTRGLTCGTLWASSWHSAKFHPSVQPAAWRTVCNDRGGMMWGFVCDDHPAVASTLQLPLWPLVILAGFVATLAWLVDALARRRERAGRCPKCNYDRAGIAAGAVCPECGSGSGGAGGASVTKPT